MNAYSIPIQFAIITFPFIAFILTIPFLIYQYRKYGAIPILKSIIFYSFILYLITAYYMVMLPLPSIEYVKKLNTDNTLKSLTIEGITFDFNKDILEYNLEVGHDVDEIIINYEADNEKANVKIEGDLTLNIGRNEKKLIVTAENGETRTYTLIINRKEAEKIEQEVEEIIKEENIKIPSKGVLIFLLIVVIVILLVFVFITKKKTRNKK